MFWEARGRGHRGHGPVRQDGRYPRLEDGQIVNEKIIRAGFAWVYHTYCKKPVCLDWKREEDEARAAKQGLWTDKNPVPPWEWRAQKRETR